MFWNNFKMVKMDFKTRIKYRYYKIITDSFKKNYLSIEPLRYTA